MVAYEWLVLLKWRHGCWAERKKAGAFSGSMISFQPANGRWSTWISQCPYSYCIVPLVSGTMDSCISLMIFMVETSSSFDLCWALVLRGFSDIVLNDNLEELNRFAELHQFHHLYFLIQCSYPDIFTETFCDWIIS